MCVVTDNIGHVFFVEAGVGIRDLGRSHGIGEVYKRQVSNLPTTVISGALVVEEKKGWSDMCVS